MKKEIFAKRVELLERTVKDFNQLRGLDVYYGVGRYSWAEGADLLRAGKPASSSVDAALNTTIKLKDAQAEVSVVMTLDAIYFGPKTREAAHALTQAARVNRFETLPDGIY